MNRAIIDFIFMLLHKKNVSHTIFISRSSNSLVDYIENYTIAEEDGRYDVKAPSMFLFSCPQ